MVKVFLNSELDMKKNQHVIYSELYEVTYWIKEGEFWKKKTIMYRTASKGRSVEVFYRFKKDFRDKEVSIVSIIYQ